MIQSNATKGVFTMSDKPIDYTKRELKTLPEIPMLSVTDIKESPMKGFSQADTHDTGVYITNRNEVVGVMLTQTQYEDLVHELEDLRAKTRDLI